MVEDLANGEKVIVSALTGGVLIPDSFINKRQHMQALRADFDELKEHHRWRFTPASDGTHAIRHVATDRFIEPLRKAENAAVYENVRFQGPILLETGPLAEARNEWVVRPRGEYVQIALKDTRFVVGLTHPDHGDSWVTLMDDWASMDRLWIIQDVP